MDFNNIFDTIGNGLMSASRSFQAASARRGGLGNTLLGIPAGIEDQNTSNEFGAKVQEKVKGGMPADQALLNVFQENPEYFHTLPPEVMGNATELMKLAGLHKGQEAKYQNVQYPDGTKGLVNAQDAHAMAEVQAKGGMLMGDVTAPAPDKGTSQMQDYEYDMKDREKNGQPRISFQAWQNEDANRKVRIASAGAAKYSNTYNEAVAQGAGEKKYAENDADIAGKWSGEIKGLRSQLSNVNTSLKLMQGGLETGAGKETLATVGNWLATVAPQYAPEIDKWFQVSGMAQFKSAQKGNVIAALGGLGRQISDQDRNFMEEVFANSSTPTIAAQRIIAHFGEDARKRIDFIQSGLQQYNSGRNKDFSPAQYESTWEGSTSQETDAPVAQSAKQGVAGTPAQGTTYNPALPPSDANPPGGKPDIPHIHMLRANPSPQYKAFYNDAFCPDSRTCADAAINGADPAYKPGAAGKKVK